MILDFKILIIEDSISFALELSTLIKKIGYSVYKIIDTAEEALESIKLDIPDLILLDITLNGKMTGIELSKKIAHLKIPIIFITSSINEENYFEAKNSKTLAYLTKPISSFSLRTSIETTIDSTFSNRKEGNKNKTQNEYLFFKKKHTFHKVNIYSITHIKSCDNYCEVITTKNEIFLIREKISNIIGNIVPADNFIRIHRQFIIQLNKIEVFDSKNNKILINEKKIPVSKTYIQKVEKLFTT